MGIGFVFRYNAINGTCMNEKIEAVKKIAVLRANALGDFIVTLPALHALRKTYPDSEIVLLGKTWHEQFLRRGRTPVDRVIVMPPIKGLSSETGEHSAVAESFFCRLQEEQFDIALGMQGKGVAANRFLNRLHARITAGSYSPEAQSIDRSIPYYYYQHEVFRYLEIAALVGATTDQVEPRLTVLKEDWQEIAELIHSLAGRPYMLLNPFANDVRRMWLLENYVPVAKHFLEKGFAVLVTGSAGEYTRAEALIKKTAENIHNVCGISLGALAALASDARLMISADTGPLHLAQAVGCPTVGIYWAPNVINWAPLNRKLHRPVIDWNLRCSVCGIQPIHPHPFEPSSLNCRHEHSFVSGVTVNEVIQQAEEIIASLNYASQYTGNVSLAN
jgi:ADP-heptose:LPS heptosyltransferase